MKVTVKEKTEVVSITNIKFMNLPTTKTALIIQSIKDLIAKEKLECVVHTQYI